MTDEIKGKLIRARNRVLSLKCYYLTDKGTKADKFSPIMQKETLKVVAYLDKIIDNL